MSEPRTEAGRVAQYTLPHFDTCAGLHGPNDCDCGVVAHVLAIEAEAAALAAEPDDRLRAALQRIVDSEPSVGSWDGWREVRRLRDIALAALDAKP